MWWCTFLGIEAWISIERGSCLGILSKFHRRSLDAFSFGKARLGHAIFWLILLGSSFDCTLDRFAVNIKHEISCTLEHKLFFELRVNVDYVLASRYSRDLIIIFLFNDCIFGLEFGYHCWLLLHFLLVVAHLPLKLMDSMLKLLT